MRCHYEVLNVSREADEAEIKSSYKKLALKLHPDKNLEDVENAKEQFQLVQQAYEVLSDKQERAWYDRHREQILHGANSDLADNKDLDVFQYFTTSCFKGYGDDDNGFYTVYRKVFDQIAKEDLDYYENKEEFVNIPSFGTSESDFDNIVNPFYAHWMSYSTKKSYVWLDPYSITDIRDRRYLKAAEKENKKVRSKAKKERNEEIRNLVAFVRKRDKRVQAWNKQNDAKIENNRKKQDDLRRQKLEENRKMNESQVQAEWTKFENMTSELQEIEKNLNTEFGNSDVSEEDEYSDLYCAACNKLFKTEKSFQNHESSKKHKENVLLLRSQLLEDEKDENSSEVDDINTEEDHVADIESELSSGKRPTNQEDEESDASEEEIDIDIPRRKKTKTKSSSHHHISPDTDSEDIPHILHKKPNKIRKNKNVLKVESTDDEFKMSSTFPASTSSDDFSVSKKGKKQNKKNKVKKTQPVNNTNGEPPQDSNVLNTEKTLKTTLKEETVNYICSTCSKNYPSKNKLFQHLKAEGHGIALPSNPTGATTKARGKNKSSKK